MLHVNPRLDPCGLLVVYNPLEEARTKTLEVDVYYAGARDRIVLRPEGGDARTLDVDRTGQVDVEVTVPPLSMTWFLIERAD